ncbi:MAG: alcohol dehydrogenase [Planctomycetes bacterium]|nr:alcohol dehydrogenase [Planctomycetota bacterium]NBY02053.1 alcohol dehydrogenase [Planctomycetota bacterium]
MADMANAALFNNRNIPFDVCNFKLDPPLGDQVLVKVEGCTICGSDIHSFLGRRVVEVPTVLGHEIVGKIVSFGPENNRCDYSGNQLKVGDRITWSVVANCGSCLFCLRGVPQKCDSHFKYGHKKLSQEVPWTGGLAEYILLVHGTKIFRVPGGLSLEAACPANCTTATNVAAFRVAGNLAGKIVLVVGAGMLGITACAMAKFNGARKVIVCDTNEKRLLKAHEFGADESSKPEDLSKLVSYVTHGLGVDVMFEMTGVPGAFENAFNCLGIGGKVVLVGSVFSSRPVSLDMEIVVRKLLSIEGIHNYTPDDLCQALFFLNETRNLPWESLVGIWLRLAEVDLAFQLAQSPEYYRVGISNDINL